jgi:hypothetical protein
VGFTVLGTGNEEKKSVCVIQCCVLKLERNTRVCYTVLCTKPGEK